MPPDVQADRDPQKASQPAPEAAKTQMAKLKVNAQGVVAATTLDEMWRLCSMWIESGMVPDTFRQGNPQQNTRKLMIAHQALSSMGLNPLYYLNCVGFIRGRMTFYGEIQMTVLNMQKRLAKPPKTFCVDRDGLEICLANKNIQQATKPYAGVCEMVPANVDEVYTEFYTIEQAQAAGLYPSKDQSAWRAHTDVMLKKTARNRLIRALFPDIMNIGFGPQSFGESEESDAVDVAAENVKNPCHVDVNALYAEGATEAESVL